MTCRIQDNVLWGPDLDPEDYRRRQREIQQMREALARAGEDPQADPGYGWEDVEAMERELEDRA